MRIKVKEVLYELSNFDVTIWDRKIHDIDEMPNVDSVEEVSPFPNNDKKISKNEKAMLCEIWSCFKSVS